MKCNGGTSWFGNGGEARCQMHRCTISLLTSTWCTLHTLLMYNLPFTSLWYSGNTILLNYSVFVLLQYVSFFKHVYCTVYIHAFDIFSIGVLSPFLDLYPVLFFSAFCTGILFPFNQLSVRKDKLVY